MNTTNLHFTSNRVRDIEQYFYHELRGLYPEGEIRSFVYMLFDAFMGWDTAQFLLHRDDTINQSDLLRFHWAVEGLLHYRPIQHIIGYTDYCGCRIQVSPDVLIPRPETEEITTYLINRFSTTPPTSILDLCTGSGCIAIALKRTFPASSVTAVDTSPAALEIARKNASYNSADISFLQADIHSPQFTLHDSKFNLIVSNPPYIRQSEQSSMSPNVLDHEPHLALFVPDSDPLLFYRSIAQLATKFLATDGLLAIEINEALADQTSALLQSHGFSTAIHQDFRDKPRLITAQYKNL